MKLSARGFTLVEMAVVLGIVAIVMSMASLALSNSPTKTTLDTSTQVLVTYIKQQQMAALSGETEGRANPDNYGIHFSTTKYSLFHGLAYSSADTSNFDINLDDFTLSSTFPNNNIVFLRSSGEIMNFQNGQNTILVKQNNNPYTKIITINKYGAIESINQI